MHHYFRQEERTRLDQITNDDTDDRHIDFKNDETLHEMDFLTHSVEISERKLYILRSIPTEVSKDNVELGSLVKTDKRLVLAGAAYERMDMEGLVVIGISTAALVMPAIRGKRVSETAQVGSITHAIKEIY